MRPCKYVIDTGYLIALYRVRGTDDEFAEVARRFREAKMRGYEVIVPWPAFFELAAHVAEDHRDRNQVRQCAIEIATDLRMAIEEDDDRMFAVSPSPSPEEILELLDVYARLGIDGKTGYAEQGFSLVDTAVAETARVLHAKYGSDVDIIIWTWERKRVNLRSYSPARELDPYPDWTD